MCDGRFLAPQRRGSRFSGRSNRRSPFDFDCAKDKCESNRRSFGSFAGANSLSITMLVGVRALPGLRIETRGTVHPAKHCISWQDWTASALRDRIEYNQH